MNWEVARCERNCHSDLVYCEWGEWSDYGGCSATCGSAVKSRMRSLRLVEAPETVRRLVGPNGTTWSGMLDAGALEEKYLGLELATRRLQTRRFQTLVVAWAAGAVSLGLSGTRESCPDVFLQQVRHREELECPWKRRELPSPRVFSSRLRSAGARGPQPLPHAERRRSGDLLGAQPGRRVSQLAAR